MPQACVGAAERLELPPMRAISLLGVVLAALLPGCEKAPAPAEAAAPAGEDLALRDRLPRAPARGPASTLEPQQVQELRAWYAAVGERRGNESFGQLIARAA